MAGQLKITWKKSHSGHKPEHRATIKALGLKRLHHTVVRPDNPQVRGMVRAVDFLVDVEEVK